jgi:zinc transport system substrate-binding protein
MSSPARRLVALAAVPLFVLAACGDDDDGEASASAGGDPIDVVAAFYPVAEAAEQVGGDLVEVTNLTPAGTEPHDLELTPDQVDDIEDADVVLYLGQGFQPAVAEAAERRGDDQVTVDVLDGIALEPGGSEALESEEHGEEGEEHSEEEEGEEHSEEALDPHFWLDPQLMADAVDQIEAALGDADPADAEAFGTGAQRYGEELTALDQEMEAGLSSCERDEIVTSHAAFYYLANRYGLTQLPIAGLSPESEPDADRLAELADRVEEDGITTVFYEDLVSPDVAETLAREAGVETARLSPLEGLTEEQAEAGDDYVSVMRQNLAALQQALGCTS